ncbi:type II secretion system F family protein [Novosphingobium bradum]|uniref:Type II secretion system F family protein n=1 Tax=Novosphingobium bradum TaxID=1737444 RepID=A0ABV7IP50_9SPHN
MPQIVIRIAVLLAIFASVFLVSELVLGAAWRRRDRGVAINRRLALIREGTSRDHVMAALRKNTPGDGGAAGGLLAGPYRAFRSMLFAAAVPLGAREVLLAMAGGFAAVLALLLIAARMAGFGSPLGVMVFSAVLAGILAVFLPVAMLSMRGQRRRKRIEQQFPVALDIFVRALRAGHPIASALEMLTEEMADPIGSEFGLVADEVSYGADLKDALQAMADRWDNDDLRMFVVSLSVQSETGGNLAEILENLADVIRARAAMFMKVRALSSEGRLTAWILSVLPAVSLAGMFLVNPAFYLETAQDPMFVWGFGILILLYLVGLLWIRRMIDLKV